MGTLYLKLEGNILFVYMTGRQIVIVEIKNESFTNLAAEVKIRVYTVDIRNVFLSRVPRVTSDGSRRLVLVALQLLLMLHHLSSSSVGQVVKDNSNLPFMLRGIVYTCKYLLANCYTPNIETFGSRTSPVFAI